MFSIFILCFIYLGPNLIEYNVYHISLYNSPHKDNQQKIALVKEIYNNCNIENEVVVEIKKYTDNAFKILNSLDLPKEKHEFLHNFGDSLMKRKI